MGNQMTQLSFTPKKRFTRNEIGQVTLTGAPQDANIYPEGTVVKMSGDNTYDIAASTDVPIGIIVVAANRYLNGVNSLANGDTAQRIVTVQLEISGLMTGVASAVITAGQELKQTGVVTLANEIAPTYAPAATGDYIVGIAINGGAVNADFQLKFIAPRKK